MFQRFCYQTALSPLCPFILHLLRWQNTLFGAYCSFVLGFGCKTFLGPLCPFVLHLCGWQDTLLEQLALSSWTFSRKIRCCGLHCNCKPILLGFPETDHLPWPNPFCSGFPEIAEPVVRPCSGSQDRRTLCLCLAVPLFRSSQELGYKGSTSLRPPTNSYTSRPIPMSSANVL
jgi:hypothetical protein